MESRLSNKRLLREELDYIITGLSSQMLSCDPYDFITISKIISTVELILREFPVTNKCRQLFCSLNNLLFLLSVHAGFSNTIDLVKETNLFHRSIIDLLHTRKICPGTQWSRQRRKLADAERYYCNRTQRIPAFGTVKIYGNWFPCARIGGDFYNVFEYRNKMIFYLGDVSGDGMATAMLSVFINLYMSDWIQYDGLTSPAVLMKRLYNLLAKQELFKDNLMTLFIGAYNSKSKKLKWVSAGHYLPVVAASTLLPLADVSRIGRPVCNLFGGVEYENNTTFLKKEQKLLLFSDGLIEWEKNSGEFFGMKGLANKLEQSDYIPSTVEGIVHDILVNIQNDDVAFLYFDFSQEFSKKYDVDYDDVHEILDEFEHFVSGRFSSRIYFRALQCFCESLLSTVKCGNCKAGHKQVSVWVKCWRGKNRFSVKCESVANPVIDFPGSRTRYDRNAEYIARFLLKKFANRLKIIENKNMIICDIY